MVDRRPCETCERGIEPEVAVVNRLGIPIATVTALSTKAASRPPRALAQLARPGGYRPPPRPMPQALRPTPSPPVVGKGATGRISIARGDCLRNLTATTADGRTFERKAFDICAGRPWTIEPGDEVRPAKPGNK